MMVDATTFSWLMNKSKDLIPLEELHRALEHNEKLERLPDTIEINVIYRLSLGLNTKDAYQCDPYSWKNIKKIQYPKINPEFVKIYYTSLNAEKKKDSRCTKHVYISKKNAFDVLVCYLGNLNIATKHSHGNCKKPNAHLLHHTPAATIQQIDHLVTSMSGDAAYKTLVATSGDSNAPRNAAQCNYRRQKYLQQQKITEDEMRNIIILSYELNGFFKMLQVQPELIIVLMHDEMKNQFSKLVKKSKEKITLFYDTTFSLGEIFVSILSFQHSMFSERPVLPLAILMHDTKRQLAHEEFVHSLSRELPDLQHKCILVTDGEPALKNAFHKYYPSMLQLLCWNHVMKNLKYHAKKYFDAEQESHVTEEHENVIEQHDNQLTSQTEVVTRVIDTIKNLLRALSLDDFLVQYGNISKSWPPEFRAYFDTHHLSTIDEIGGWTSRPLNLFDEDSGVTNNASESINAVIKRWLAWKELSVDALVQMFYMVLGFYVNEIRRGFCGYGGYHLETVYNNLKTDASYLTVLSGFSPQEAVQRMKSSLLNRQKSKDNVNIDFSGINNQLSSSNSNNNTDDNVQQSSPQNTNFDETTIDRSSNGQMPIQRQTLTNAARANLVLEEGLVNYDVITKTFTVRSIDRQTVHAVHMGDRKRMFKCSCPSSLQTCAHILPVKLFLGMPLDDQDNTINLGHERKRKRMEDKIRKPGGKRPRRCDKEPKQKHTSPYFSSNQLNTSNLSQSSQNNFTSQMNTSIGLPSAVPTLANITNLPSSSSTSAIGIAPKSIKAIRFLTPINVNIPLQQQPNQHIVLKPS